MGHQQPPTPAITDIATGDVFVKKYPKIQTERNQHDIILGLRHIETRALSSVLGKR